MSQFMNTPNAELYALLAQEAAQNRLRGGGGTNVGAGSSSEIDILTAQGDLAERAAQREHGRDYSKSLLDLMLTDTMAQRQHMRGMEMKGFEQAGAEKLLGLEQANQEGLERLRQAGEKERQALALQGALDQIQLTNKGQMDVVAAETAAAMAALKEEARLRLKNDLDLTRLRLEAQQATGEKAVQIQQEIDALEKDEIAREQKMQAVQRRIAEMNPQAKLELQSSSDRIKQLRDAQGAVKNNFEKAWDEGAASIVSDFKATFLAAPAMTMFEGMGQGIMEMLEGYGEATGQSDKVFDTKIRYAFGLPLGGSGLSEFANYDALAAAVRSGRGDQGFGGALLNAVSTGRGQVLGQLSRLGASEYDKAANNFALKGMTDLFFKTLAGSGLSVDAVSGRAEVQKLLGLLMDTSTATNLDAADFQKSVRDRIMSASQAMFGPRAGDSSSQLVEALYSFIDKVGTAKGGSILNEKGQVDVDSVKNAAMQYVFERAASLRSALDAGTGRAFFTHKNLSDAFERLEKARTGDQLDPALLIRGQSQTDEILRQLLGPQLMGLLSNVDTTLLELRGLEAAESDFKLTNAQKKAELKRALESATLEGNKKQLEMIQKLLAELKEPAP